MSKISIRAAVIDCIEDLTGCSGSEITDGDVLVDDLGVDSFAGVNLLGSIEDKLGLQLPDGCEGRLVSIRTVGDLVDLLADILGESALE
jgi:acyl carrier protein